MTCPSPGAWWPGSGDSEQDGSPSVIEDPEWGLPPPLVPPPENLVTPPATFTRVYFDLEMTSGGISAHITQISAVASTEGDPTFDQYVLPGIPIMTVVSEKIHQTMENGKLCYKGEPGDAVPLGQALEAFLSYLGRYKPCMLIAHDCMQNDSPIIVKALTAKSMVERFKLVCFGFSDTLGLFQQKFPARAEKKEMYNLRSLHKDNIGLEFEAHNSLEDSIALKKVCDKTEVSDSEYMNNSHSVIFIERTNDYKKQKSLNFETLWEFWSKSVFCKKLAKTIAAKGYNKEVLQKAYDNNILDKILKARVLIRESIIQRITEYLKNGEKTS